ncbi:RHS repeat-associated core domain-containing protein [Paractinoplanes bogorensis]|uniref:RHS repeat-associated core domain-containing protein n=1 Tax=Paractinoplanes bogorensis TaxID=1610840 RepID=UPI0027DF966F|nr:RHS repeat-associated core domain-containing protein [Actinoplanes bogorensis]
MKSPLPAQLRRRTAVVAVGALLASLLHGPAASAAKPEPYKPSAAKPVPVVPVEAVKPQPIPALKQPAPASARPAPVWPAAGLRAGASGTRVEVLDRAATAKAGVRGVLMRVGRTEARTTAGPATVTVDYGPFANAYGADWSSRLRLVTLPNCALTTPAKPECAPEPIPSKNDTQARTVSGAVTVGSAQTLVALTAGPSGPAGDYSATSLSPSSTWAAGGNTGAFTWSYPMRTPPPLGGKGPDVGLSYSSQSVDGAHAASNNQPSWAGQGFETTAGGFIERRYRSCHDDMGDNANNKEKTGDLCWETDNATLSLNGHSGELLYHPTEKRWHLRGDDGSRIRREVGAVNGDNNGEYWVVTTSDGVQYWFGSHRLPGWTADDPVTNSTLTVPVFGNDPTDECHADKFDDSDCMQAWRWNLDYVVDPVGNSMSFWYVKETNKYARNNKPDAPASYDRAAYLNRIDYGTRRIAGVDSALKTLAPLRVDFTPGDRCLADCGTHDAGHWPDVPWDSSCTGDKCEDVYSPTFWSTKRLASVTTQVRSADSYRNVERWTLKHTFPDPGDTTRAGLWLSKLSHTGLVGGTATVPDIEFESVQMPNRVDTIDHSPAMNWMRIARIRNETGGSISVVYSKEDCKADEPRPAEATNTRRCYPVRWIPEGLSVPVTDWFHKYVVTTIYENDNTGGAPPKGSPRVVYSYDYLDGAAWHWTDDDGLVRKGYKTWSDYRGYGRVGVTVGDAGDQTYTEARYFRGMNNDRLSSTDPTQRRSVATDGIADENWLAGMVREEKILNGPEGAVVSRQLNTPYASAATATRTVNGDTVTARFTGIGTVASHTALDGGRGERVAKTVTSFDAFGMPISVDDTGLDGVDGDEQCTRTEYIRNNTLWINTAIKRMRTFAVKCASTSGTLTESDVISESRTIYDNSEYGTAPAKGLPTQTLQMSAWNNGTPAFIVANKTAYDVHGRVKSTTDANKYESTTTFTPAQDGPVTSIVAKNALEHEKTTTLEPAWGQPTEIEDANDKRTDLAYDALGRMTAVWTPDRVKGTDGPTEKYTYDINNDSATSVSSSVLNPQGSYVTNYTLYDGLLRARQTQAKSPTGGRIITEDFYDTAGRKVLTFGGYHNSADPSGTLVASLDRAFVPRQNRTQYDGAGRVTAEIFQPNGVERWRTSTVHAGDRSDVTPPEGGTATSTVTDVRGRTVELRQYKGAVPTPRTAGSWTSTAYKFDRRGYLASVADTLGNDWTYTYDVRGRRTEVDDPDKGKSSYTYDDAGNVLTATDARKKKIAYTYDGLNRKRAAHDNSINGDLRAQWIYDTVAKGQLSQSTRFVGSAPYQSRILSYNDRYQPVDTQIVIPESETGLTGTYNYSTTYNVDGSIESTTIPGTNTDLESETVSLGYTALGQPATMGTLYGATNSTYIESTDYNALGELDQLDRYTGTGGHVFTKYARDPATGRLSGIRTDRDSVAPYILSDTSYEYYAAGTLRKAVDAAPDPVDDTQCFTYDSLARLTEAWTPAGGDCDATRSVGMLGGPAAYWNSWQYDDIGNRKKQTTHSAAGDAVTDYAYTPSGSTAVRPHAVNNVSGATTGSYTYDETGNTLTRPAPSSGTQTMTWDAEGHLETSTDAGGRNSYVYDADGNRLIRRDPTGKTLYLAGQEIRYTAATTQTTGTRYYSFAGQTIASRTKAKLTWTASDHQGTAQIAVDAATQQASMRRQTPFGGPRGVAPSTWPDDKGFVGGTTDNTGLTHLGAREYDALLGRFISVDPIQDLNDPQQWNGYAYSNNNPATLSDPTGTIPIPTENDDRFGREQKDPYGEPEGKDKNNEDLSEYSVRHRKSQEQFRDYMKVMHPDWKIWIEFLIPHASKKKGSNGPGFADIMAYDPLMQKWYIWEVKTIGGSGTNITGAEANAPGELDDYIAHFKAAYPGERIERGERLPARIAQVDPIDPSRTLWTNSSVNEGRDQEEYAGVVIYYNTKRKEEDEKSYQPYRTLAGIDDTGAKQPPVPTHQKQSGFDKWFEEWRSQDPFPFVGGPVLVPVGPPVRVPVVPVVP